MGEGRLGCREVRPQKILQILRKLQHHNPLDAEGAALDIIVIYLIHHLLAKLLVCLPGPRCPVGLGQCCEVVPLDLLHSWL